MLYDYSTHRLYAATLRWSVTNLALCRLDRHGAHLPRYPNPVPISGPRNSAYTMHCSRINNRVVDTVVQFDLIRSNSNNSLNWSFCNRECIYLFSHRNTDGNSSYKNNDFGAVFLNDGQSQAPSFDPVLSHAHCHVVYMISQWAVSWPTNNQCMRIRLSFLNFGISVKWAPPWILARQNDQGTWSLYVQVMYR